MMIATLGVIQLSGCGDGAEAMPTSSPINVLPLEAYHPPVQMTVGDGDTIEVVCRRLAGPDWLRWRDAMVEEIDPRSLRPGTVFEGRRDPFDRLEFLTTALDLRTSVHLESAGGEISHSRIERPITSEIVRYSGIIESSLFAAIQEAGAKPELAVRMASIFQWDIDFLRDVRKGDTFVALADRQTVEGDFFAYGTLYAARFVNDGRELHALAYAGPDGRVGYYDLDGAPLEKQFLRSPLKFSRITSRFSMNRFHPVLKRRMPHYGVDYGAPVGTPVLATAAGTVTFRGRNGGAGNMMRLRHANGYETNYLHLSRYGKNTGKGARVAQGQVIGYVGSTGWSTGPHLDYRVKKNGRWINPLTISSPPAKPLPDTMLKRYLAHALALVQVLDGKRTPIGARS